MDLIGIWIALLGFAIILYVILDGFGLGIALLFPFTRNEEERSEMIESIAPVWDANQTWLVFGGGGLFVAFPLLYGVLFSALYIPLFTLLYGLIFRGVSFEFRANSARKHLWDTAFFCGSFVAVASQGLTLGGVLSGVKVSDGSFAGGTFDWLTPFSVMAALGLITGYILLGSTYLIIKTTGTVQKRAYLQAYWAAIIVLILQFVMVVWTPFHYSRTLTNWLTPPRIYFIWIFPVVSLAAFYGIIRGLCTRKEFMPFACSVLFFFSGYLALLVSIYPHALPPDITFHQAAAEAETMRFTFWGALITLPVVLGYTIYSYTIFRGKVGRERYYH